jgi:hypothetical protein
LTQRAQAQRGRISAVSQVHANHAERRPHRFGERKGCCTDYKLIRARIDELNLATMPLAERVMNRAVATALEGKRVADV